MFQLLEVLSINSGYTDHLDKIGTSSIPILKYQYSGIKLT